MKNKFKDTKSALICAICGKKATHVVLAELREKPGPPLQEDNVLHLVCEEHSKNTNLQYWIPYNEWQMLFYRWKRLGYLLNKEFCNIHIKKLRSKDDSNKSKD